MIILQLISASNGDWILALVSILAFMLAVTVALVLHEVAHGYVALWNGDDTARLYGRLTLNPLKHFNLLGLAMMLLVGFGFANPVPVNPNNFRNRRKGEILVSVAGILTNLALAFISVLFYGLLLSAMPTSASSNFVVYLWYFGYMFFSLFILLNINFALFNVLPLYPLDGYRLINSFVPSENRAMTFLRRYSQYILIGLVIWGSVSYISSYSPLTLYLSYGRSGITWLFEKFWSLFGLSFTF